MIDEVEPTTALLRAAVRSMAGTTGGENHDRGLADPERGLLLVADGMGGLPLATASADKASALVADFLDASSDGPALLGAVEAAGNAVAHMARNAGVERSGTTLCVGLIHDGRLLVANVGDSRCYLVRDGVATKLTIDHTAAARLIADGTIEDGSPAAADLERSLDRYLGRAGTGPDMESHEIQSGDRLLFCTDGVHRALSHEALTSLLVGEGRPAEVAELLIGAARDAGGTDDATAVVADVGYRPADAVSVRSAVGGALLAPGETVTVGRAGQGADIGFSDPAVHGQAARITVTDDGWSLDNTGRRLVLVVRDRRSSLRMDVPPFRSLPVPFSEAEVILTTRYGEHSFEASCPSLDGSSAIVPSITESGTGDSSYPFEKSSVQFRTLVAVCSLLRGKRWGRRLTAKAVYRRVLIVEPDVTLKAVTRRLDEVSDKILGPGVRDLRGLADKAMVTGTVTQADMSLIEAQGP